MNEADSLTHTFRLEEAFGPLEKAVELGFTPAYSKLIRNKGWTNSWKGFEQICHNVSLLIISAYKNILVAVMR